MDEEELYFEDGFLEMLDLEYKEYEKQMEELSHLDDDNWMYVVDY